MINRVFKNIKVLIISIVFAILFCVNASAFSTNLKEIKVLESNFEVTDPVIEGNNITNNITFNNKDDYVVFELTLKNNDIIKYTIDSIEDNNTNKNLVLSYDYQNKIVDKNSEFKVKVKLHYKNRLENVERIDLNNIKITINMISDDGKSSSIIVNPTTGDSILKYLVLLIIALSGLIIKQKKKSIGKVLIVLPILFLPFVIFANQKYKQEITFNSVTIKGEFLPYNITINIPGQDSIIKTITYGDEIGELPDVDIEGYTFDGWEDNKGNKVDENTKVTGEIEISPKLTPIEYNITYDLNGGTALNPTKYTIEDKITLKNPVKEGYNFSGWTGSNGDSLQTEVIINKGTTGNLNYIAHYSNSDTTPYKVIHRKQKLTLDGYDVEETDNLSGTTDSTVRPQTKNYTGFISPEETDLVITGDGKATLTYDYNRIIYTIDMDNLEDMTSNLPSGDYPYGTEVILTPDVKEGYDFDGWNDGNTDNPRTINIDGPITIKPTYKPKTDTPYKVTHKFQNIDLLTYTDEVESKTGTTGENVTPGVKEREGFISPNTQTSEIKGDGTTEFIYVYNRETYEFVIDDSEDVISSKPSGNYPYGTEIELEAKEKDGYTFDGWNDGNKDNPRTIVVGDNTTIKPIYKANTDTRYKVEHKKQNITLDGYDLADTDNLTGTTGATITPSVRNYEGFTSPDPVEATIKADGSLVVTYNYTRNTYEFVIEDTEDVISSKPSGNYPYGTEVELEAKEKPGYTFDGWNDGNTDNPRTITIGDNTSVKPIYKPNTNTKYVVNHYKQNVTLDEYDLADTDNLEGTTDTKVTPNVKTYEGFTAPVPEEVTIKADGSLVVTYNYNRKTYEFVIEDSDDVISSKPSGNYPYGTEIELTAKDKAGYDFEGWSDGETTNPRTIIVNGNTTISPVYTSRKDTAYKVEHKKQNLNGSGYTTFETELLTGETNKEVTPSVKTYEGFTSPTPKTVTIKGDGTTVVEYLYTRNSYDFNYSSTENIDLNNSTPEGNYPYETEITLKAKEKDGYTFSSWSNGDTTNPTTFELTGDITISPNYEANKYNVVFNSNGGSGTMPNQEMTYDKETKLNKNIFTREGYTFAGWNKKADGTGTSYEDEANVKNLAKSGNIVLYAKWNPNDNTSYTVNHYKQTVDKSGYVLADTNNLTGTTDSVVTPETKSYTGFISPSVETITITGDGRAVLNYNYDRVEYDFTLTNSEYIESNVSQGKYPYETDITITAKEKTGYHFSNFNDNILENPYSFKLTENKTFTVNYEPNTYNVVFNSNGGSGSMNNEEFTYDVKQKLSKNGFNRTGYTFDKWNTASDGTGTSYLDEEKVENLTTSGNYNLYALWNANELIFNGDDTISKVYSTSSQEVTITGASNGTGSYTYTEVSEKKDNVDTDYITINNTTITLSSSIPAGVYTYIVKATDTNSGSEKNATYTITITKQKSDSVINLNVSPEGIVSFTNSSNADGYLISIDGINYTPVVPGEGTTSYNYLNQITGEAGNRTIYVKAINSDGDNYEVSDPVTKEVTVYTLNTSVNNDEYGTISTSSTNVISGATYTTSDNTLTLSDARTITTSKKDITGYTTTFTGWSSVSGTISQNASVTANYTRTINKYTLTINSNGGIFKETEGWTISGDTATKEYDYNTSISSFPEVSKSGYVLAGYNTKQDGSGDNITTESSITTATTIYPQWVVAKAMFDTGKNVNIKMKKLAGIASPKYYESDTNITSIQKSTTKPDISCMISDNIVSVSNETYNAPIYMWYDNGTIYWWSEDERPSFNQDSSFMFDCLKGLSSIDISSFDTSNVTNMQSMFYDCSTITNLDLRTFNTTNVTNMGGMFYNCSSLSNIDVSSFNTSNVTSMSNMFSNCSSLITLNLNSFNTFNVTSMQYMFYNCNRITNIDLSSFNTVNVTNMGNMFEKCKSISELDLTHFITSNLEYAYSLFCDCDSLKKINISGWNLSKIGTSYSLFYSSTNEGNRIDIVEIIADNVKLSSSALNTSNGIFCNMRALKKLSLKNLDISNLEDMEGAFSNCYSLTNLDLSGIDTSNVYTMAKMFQNCYSLTELDISNFNTNNVRNMELMFQNCYSLQSLDLSNFDTSNVIYMSNMFQVCPNLTTIYASNSFVTTSVTSSDNMFTGDTKLVGGMGTIFSSSHIDKEYARIDGGISNPGYFTDKSSISIRFDANGGEGTMNDQVVQYDVATPLSTNTFTKSGFVFVGWNTKIDGTGKAYVDGANIQAKSLTTLYAQWIEAQAMFDTGQNVNVKMKKLAGNSSAASYSSDTNITSIQKSTTRPDISSMTSDNIVSISNTTYNAPIYMWYDNGTIYWWSEDNNPSLNQNSSDMFRSLTELTNIDVTSFDTSNVTDMAEMFDQCSSLIELDVSSFNTSNVTKMYGMFEGCSSLTSLNLGENFNTNKVITMSSMFEGCSSLTSLDLGDKFDTSNVTNMESMFANCSSLTSIDLGENFDTSNVTRMSYMFYGCSSLTSIDLGDKFDTSNVTGMYSMFRNCSSLTSIDLSNFNTNKVTGMRDMFNSCSRLETIYASNSFVTTSVTSSDNMFTSDTKLVGGMGTIYSISHTDKEYAHIDGGTSNPGYFTDKSTINIKFDANGGEGTMNDQVVQYDVATPLNANIFTREGYIFNGWNTAPDRSGTAYADGANIQAKSLTTLYAQWIEARAMFDTGASVNTKMKKLAGNASVLSFSSDTNITSIQKSSTKPDISSMTSDNIVSTSTLYIPIYMWYDNGTIYWWSEDDTPYLNTDSSDMFSRCSSLTSLDLSNFDTSKVTDMNNMFRSCRSLTSLDVSKFDTSNVTYMYNMFSYCSGLTSLDLSNFDTSKVTNIFGMFSDCSSLTSLNVSNFDTSKVTNMQMMFQNCSSLTNLDVSSFDTSNVTSMPWMFSNCKLLTKLDVSKFDTSKVTNMSYMFSYCSNLTNLNIGDKFDTSEVTNMSYMFSSCSNLTNLNIGDKFDTSKVTNMQMMFQNCSSLTILDLGDKFDTSNVTNMSGTFRDLKSLTKLDVSNFDTSNVTDMSWMFLNCSSLTSLDISSFDTGKVTTMQGMFDGCVKITTLDLSTFDTKNVTNMSAMFWDCKSLTKLDVSSFDTSNVTAMGLMFSGCSSLTSLDLSSFDTSNVTSMSDMFCSCSRLTNLDLSLFNTSKVTDMNNMFQKCSSLTTLRLGAKFDTSNVKTMISMFKECSSLTSLDLSSFNTSKVTNISWMFQWMDNITTIYASDLFAISSVTNSIAVFSGDKKLVGGSGTKYSSSNITDATYAHIDRGTSNPGYFTYKAAPTSGNISRFINAFNSLNAKISKYVLGVFIVIALILSTVLLIIRSIKKRKIRKC